MDIVDKLYAASREHEALEEYDFVETPKPPAEPAILALLAEKLALSPDHVAFLTCADGWANFAPGWELLETAKLEDAQADAATTFEDCETDPEVAAAAVVVGRSSNDAGLLFYDRRTRTSEGRMELVEWLYEDQARYRDLEAYFSAHLAAAEAGIADEKAARAETEEEWTAAWRARDAGELRESTRARLAIAELAPALTSDRIARLAIPRSNAIAPEMLEAEDAKLCISLLVHLRGAPSPSEIRQIVAAFRKHFPEPAFPLVARFSWDEARRATLSAADPILDEAIGRPARGGAMGISVTLASHGGTPPLRFMRSIEVTDPVLDIQVPGPLRRKEAASCIDVKFPLGTDPTRVRALAHDLANIVPFLFGYASYSAIASGISGVTSVYEWSRRCLSLDVRDARLELGALRDSVKNAAWLTLLGEVFTASLRERFGAEALVFDAASEVKVAAARHGLVIEAGSLDLGDVQATAFPFDVAEIDRRIAPLRLRGFSNEELLSIGGVRYMATYTRYDGPFGDGSATRDWLERWSQPARHLGPTPREQGEAHLGAVDAAAGTSGLVGWAEIKKKEPSFNDLLRQITVTVHGAETQDESIAALEWASCFSEPSQPILLSKLFYGLLQRNELERAKPYLALVADCEGATGALFHNAACVVARLGDRDAALAFTKRAKENAYSEFASMRTDSDLAVLSGNPVFEALFG